MKRRASQDQSRAPKRTADDSSYSETETNDESSYVSSATTTELLDSSSCVSSPTATPPQLASDDDACLEKVVTLKHIDLPDEIPTVQIARPALLRVRATSYTFFSLLSSDIFALILGKIYKYANEQEPLGVVNVKAAPDISVDLLRALPKVVQIRHVGPSRYAIGSVLDCKPMAAMKWPQCVDFSDLQCAEEESAKFLMCGAASYSFSQETDEYLLRIYASSCRTKGYMLSDSELHLTKFGEYETGEAEIAQYETTPEHYCCVVFSSNCVGLIKQIFHPCKALKLEYFSPRLDYYTEYDLDPLDPVSCCCDNMDNLYLFGRDATPFNGVLCIYSFANEVCTVLNRIPLGDALGCCLAPKGDLVVARETHVNLYRKK